MRTTQPSNRLKRLSDLPIKWKVIGIVLATNFLALFLALLTLVTEGYVTLRRNLIQDTTVLAQVIGMNSASALVFQDMDSALEILSGLRVKKRIVAGFLYTAEGRPFASYLRDPGDARAPALPSRQGAYFREAGLEVLEPIVLDGKPVGFIYLESDLRGVQESMARVLAMAVIAILTALAVAFFLSTVLHRFISAPIASLARTARRVSTERNYSLREQPRGDDEIGGLVKGFNEMLGQIQFRDQALQRSNTELSKVNRHLEAEIAERKRAEEEIKKYAGELERSNRELDDFAYIASHDLKEPLRGIHNYSNFLLEDYGDKLDEEGKAKLETLLRLTRRLESLIEALLQYSRLGRLDLAVKEVDLNQMMAEVTDTIHSFLEENGADVRIPRPLPVIRCDAARVSELFLNLVTNAVKYNDKPEKRVEVGWSADGPEPVFYVRDNGIGIPDKHFHAIFRIFKRLHGKDRFGGGTGAGLTIVKKIVERHGGRIWVESAVGEGTTFYFTLQPSPEAAP